MGDQTHVVPATSGELEPMPNGTHELSWLVPEGGAQSTFIAKEEQQSLLNSRHIIYAD
jgi:hypothetical protein